jgi:hypothetical protein
LDGLSGVFGRVVWVLNLFCTDKYGQAIEKYKILYLKRKKINIKRKREKEVQNYYNPGLLVEQV